MKKPVRKGVTQIMDMKYREILTGDRPLGKYPLHLLKRVDSPTNKYAGEITRRDPDETAFDRAANGEYGEEIADLIKKFHGREPLLASFVSLQTHLAKFGLPPVAEEKAPIPEDARILTRHIKALAYFAGADMAGICRLPQSALYLRTEERDPIECDLSYAIVLLNVKHTDTIRSSYGREWIDDPTSFAVYQRSACQAQVIAGYIRRLGWAAETSIFDKYLTVMPQLIIEAGLGEESRMGIALNPFVGSAFKTSAVLTDLPLEADKPIDFGLQDYCSNCKICAEQCPMRAISFGDKELYNGYEAWPLKYRNCVTGVVTNKTGNICERCIKICPWNRPDNRPENFREWDGNVRFLHDSVNRQAGRLRANGYREPEEYTDKWWFPLLYADGSLIDAPEFDYAELDRRLAAMKKDR